MGNSDKHPNNQDEQANSDNHIISIKMVAITYFGGLSIAMIITWGIGGFAPDLIPLAHLFPMGCLAIFDVHDFDLRYGYVVYVIIFIYAFIGRQKPVFITLLVIYIVILCVNIRGCHLMMNIDIH